jgi:hypothetical protein
MSLPRANTSAGRQRAYRSLGLSLAIMGVFVLFGVFSIFPGLLVVLVRLQGHVYEPVNGLFFWGTQFVGVAMMVVCVFAWVGSPRRIRIYFLVFMVLALASSILISLRPEVMNFMGLPGVPMGSSLSNVFESYLRCLLPWRIILFIYVIWYCNRPVVLKFYAR